MKKTFEQVVHRFDTQIISPQRKLTLDVLVDFIQTQLLQKNLVRLNFICTHNSRRSQFAQLWACFMSSYYRVNSASFSGGVQTTAFNERVIACLKSQGFDINSLSSGENPHYALSYEDVQLGTYFSKHYQDSPNPKAEFAAVMTCSDADHNCPIIPGAIQRIPLRYQDPKQFDQTTEEKQGYLKKSIEIATEMKYVFMSV